MARSRTDIVSTSAGFVWVGSISIALFTAALGGCSPPPPVQVAPVVAPLPQQYTCAQQRQMRAELAALPAGSMLPQAIADYLEERDKLRAVHNLPAPERCP